MISWTGSRLMVWVDSLSQAMLVAWVVSLSPETLHPWDIAWPLVFYPGFGPGMSSGIVWSLQYVASRGVCLDSTKGPRSSDTLCCLEMP